MRCSTSSPARRSSASARRCCAIRARRSASFAELARVVRPRTACAHRRRHRHAGGARMSARRVRAIPIVALDVPTAERRARAGRRRSAIDCRFYKVGSELFTAAGPGDRPRAARRAGRRRLPRPQVPRHSEHRRRRGAQRGARSACGSSRCTRPAGGRCSTPRGERPARSGRVRRAGRDGADVARRRESLGAAWGRDGRAGRGARGAAAGRARGRRPGCTGSCAAARRRRGARRGSATGWRCSCPASGWPAGRRTTRRG